VRLDKKEIFMMVKEKKIPTGRTKFGAVIGDHTQLGINALIMCGIKIGARSRIGAGTVVTEDVPDDTTVYMDQTKVVKNKKRQ
jgi:bifunctional UDP-N-acetylglucosamine pyrophosphorylase/glucosamine-1-phosphate N-acetyltransferase